MIIGNKEEFAIHFELDHYFLNRKEFIGQFCFYINNQQFGRFDEISSLITTMNFLEYNIEYRQNTTCSLLYSFSNKKIFDCIFNYFYYDDPRLLLYIPANYEPEQLRVDIYNFCMDDYLIYLVDNEKYTKVIYGYIDNGAVLNRGSIVYSEIIPRSIILPKGQCDRIISEACHQLQQLYNSMNFSSIGDNGTASVTFENG